LALAYAQFADALKFQGKRDEALDAYGKALDIHRKLTELDPRNLSWQFDLWNDLQMQGGNFSYEDKLDKAEAAYADALSIIERLTAADPARDVWQAALAQTHGRLGDMAMSRVEAAALEIHVAASQGNGARVQDQLSIAVKAVGVASRAYDESFEILQKLTDENPDHLQWQEDLAYLYTRIGWAAYRQNARLDEAEQAYREALSRLTALVERDPTNEQWQRHLSSTYRRLSVLLEQQRRWDEAIECAEASLKIVETMPGHDSDNPDRRATLEYARSEVDKLRQMKAEDGQRQVESPGERTEPAPSSGGR
jgi:tetratricopeptide (TPR) repeat protein